MKEGFIQGFFARFNPQSAPDIVSLGIGAPRDFSNRYPTVPPPEAKFSPQLLAAAWTCHDVYGEEMPAIAANLLEAGYDSPSLRRLAGEIGVACSADVEETVARVFRELDVCYPLSEMQARLVVIRQVAREVIAGRRDGERAARYIRSEIGWDRKAPGDLGILFELLDDLVWNSGHLRFANASTDEFFDAFARIALIADEQIFTEEGTTS
jgi:DNA-binding transcriptional regulator YhcF (GntR family)